MWLAVLPAFFALGCSGSERAPTIERVEMRLSGWTALDVSVNKMGQGQYHSNRPRPGGNSGSFSIQPQQFASILQRLEPFRRQAVPVTERSKAEFVEGKPCPEGTPFVTDAGGFYVRWVGPSYNQHYLADLGCDWERNVERNKALLAIVESLPVPQP
jgi:hypothetical protein